MVQKESVVCSMLRLFKTQRVPHNFAWLSSAHNKVNIAIRTMRFFLAFASALLLLYGGSQVSAQCLSSWSLGVGACNYNELVSALTTELAANGCGTTALVELTTLLGVSTELEVKQELAEICAAAYMKFGAISGEGDIFDKEYFDGGTYWNEEREYVTVDGIIEDRLATVPGTRIKQIYNDIAKSRGITWPGNLDNFAGECKYGAAMCCFVQDRQAKDNNGNCALPYATGCHDADPADNVDVCYVDMERAPTSSRTTKGFAIFEGNAEDDSHCHGLAWSSDPTHESARFKGGNLFYVSMYDHFIQRGYVRNVPGSPMCACVEQMAVVDRSDCTEIAVTETGVKFVLDNDEITASIDTVDIAFKPCEGVGGQNNDLQAYYRRLVQEGRRSEWEFRRFSQTVVGRDKCRPAIDSFLKVQGLMRVDSATGGKFDQVGMTEEKFGKLRG